MSTEIQESNIFSFLGRHIVAFSGILKSPFKDLKTSDDKQPFIFPGWILSIYGSWIYVTAGHNLELLDKRINEGYELLDCSLTDCFGPEAKHTEPIPFDYKNREKFYEYNEQSGIDVGLIPLSKYYKNLLESNGIIPVTEENWIHQDLVDFEKSIFFIAGFPTELQKRTKLVGQNSITTVDSPLVFLKVRKSDEILSPCYEKSYPRFVGVIDDLCLDSIVGMSGGPIFGFNKSLTKYWIVAVQSSWDRYKNITFGCPIMIFARQILQSFEDMIAELEN